MFEVGFVWIDLNIQRPPVASLVLSMQAHLTIFLSGKTFKYIIQITHIYIYILYIYVYRRPSKVRLEDFKIL